MILDSSAIVAILQHEADAGDIIDKMDSSATTLKMSAANYLETGIVVDRGEPDLPDQLDQILADFSIEIVPVSAELARIAREAHRRFGRRSSSPAKLNFGDCFAYALARQTGEPLLFKGGDFSRTDLTAA